MELRKTEYAERYDVKLLLLFNRFHGSMHRPTIAAMYPPRRMFYTCVRQVRFECGVFKNLVATYNVSREQRGQVAARANRVGGDIRAKLRIVPLTHYALNTNIMCQTNLCDDERRRNEPDAKTRRVARLAIEELAQEVDRGPDRLPVDGL